MDEQSFEQLSKKERRARKKQQKQEAHAKRATQKKRRSALRWAIIVVVIAVIAWLINSAHSGGTSAAGPSAVTEKDWKKGQKSAPITLIEYGDFQCPACASYALLVQQLTQEYPNQLQVVYRHFPLTSIHQNAEPAARAAQAAGLQDKFWEMHDQLYEHQDDWSNLANPKDKFVEYAGLLGIDSRQFEKDFQNRAIRTAVRDQQLEAQRMNLAGTPSFLLNNALIAAPKGIQGFRTLINAELKKLGISPKEEIDGETQTNNEGHEQ